MAELQTRNSSLVQVDNDRIRASYDSVAEARMAIKELRFRKKEFSLKKRELSAAMKAIRAQYSAEIRNRGGMVRGGGKVGRFVRVVQSASRDSRRAKLAADLAPFEREKFRVEAIINAIDQAIFQIEGYVLRESHP